VLRELMTQLGDKLGIAMLPAWQDKALKPMYSTHVLAFPNQGLSKAKQADLLQLLRFMQSPAVQQRLWQELKVFPVESQAFADAKTSMAPEHAVIFEQLLAAAPLPVEPAMTYAWGSMTKGLERYLNGVMSAEDAARLMQRLTERELAKDGI
jgi:maltose-binding protein MalE